jgi:hypothetical protein
MIQAYWFEVRDGRISVLRAAVGDCDQVGRLHARVDAIEGGTPSP